MTPHNSPYLSHRDVKTHLASTLCQTQYKFFLTASLYGPSKFGNLRQRIIEWADEVDLYFNGRRALSPNRRTQRMKGVVSFEIGTSSQSPHAHIVVVPPTKALGKEFADAVSAIWSSRYGISKFNQTRRYRSITSNGIMHVVPIIPTPDDNKKVIDYALKELENSRDAYERVLYLPTTEL